MMTNSHIRYRLPLPVLSTLIAFAANLGFTVGPVSLSFFFGILLIAVVFLSFPKYAVIRKDMQLLLFFSALSFVGLFFSPVSIDGTTLFVGLQIVYWFLLANVFSNICGVVETKVFQEGVILVLLILFVTFFFLSDNSLFTENSASCIVVAIWPLGLFFFSKKVRLFYVLFVVFTLYIIGSRTGIFLIIAQIGAYFLIKKMSAKRLVASMLLLALVLSLLSQPKIRLSIAEVVFPDDTDMQMLIETPETVFQLDKSWVQRRIQQEKSKQVMRHYPIFGIGALNFTKYNIDINVSEFEDVDGRVLSAEMGRSDNRSSHNSYYQMLAENGIVGSLIIIFVFLSILVRLYNRRGVSEVFVILLISALGLFANLYMVSMFWGTSTWILLGIYSGFARLRIV